MSRCTFANAHTELDDIVELPFYRGIVAQKTPDPGVFVHVPEGGKRALMLVNHGVTVVVFAILKQVVCQEMTLHEDLLVLCHSVLAKIGHKGKD